MDHLQVQQLLDEYVSDELSPSDREKVEQHLESCEHCRKWAEMIRLQKAAFADLEHQLEIPELSAAFVDRLPARRRLTPARIAPIAAALVLVLGLGVLSLRFMSLSGASSDAAAPEAVMDTATADSSIAYSVEDEGTDSAAVVTSEADDALMVDDAILDDGSTRGQMDITTDDAADYTAESPQSNTVTTDDAAADTAGGDMEEASSIPGKDISFSALTDSTADSTSAVIGGADEPTDILVTQEGSSSFFIAHAAWLIPVGVGLIALIISGTVWLIVKRKY